MQSALQSIAPGIVARGPLPPWDSFTSGSFFYFYVARNEVRQSASANNRSAARSTYYSPILLSRISSLETATH